MLYSEVEMNPDGVLFQSVMLVEIHSCITIVLDYQVCHDVMFAVYRVFHPSNTIAVLSDTINFSNEKWILMSLFFDISVYVHMTTNMTDSTGNMTGAGNESGSISGFADL